jgi:lipopolysaccharide export system permease protein
VGVLQRSTLRQFVPPFIFAIVVLAFVLLMDRLFLLADLLVRKGVEVKVVAEVAALSLPFVISITAPLGSLISGVMTFGRMAQDNEIRVVRAAGIPVTRVFMPAALACGALLPVMIAFNGYAVPEAQHRVRNLLTDVARKKPALRIRERVFMDDFPGYVAYIGSIDERRSRVSNVVIFDRNPGKGPPSFVTAPEGDLAYTSDGRYMVLKLRRGEIHEQTGAGSYRRLAFERHLINVKVDDELVRRDREYRSDQEMMMPQLAAQLRQFDREEAALRDELAATAADSLAPGAQEARQREVRSKLRYKRLEAARFESELQKRLSLASSCFLFLLFGAPVGLLLRKGGVGTGFVVGLVFFGVYYILLLAGQNFADSGKLAPFVGMWLPNLVLVLPVVELFCRALFEQSPLLYAGRLLRRA